MKKDCDDIRPLLDAWIDGELSSSDRRRVARHAEGCPDCREEAESRRGIDAALSADDKAGDPGDAYFATLGDRVGARFDFTEAAQHWAKPEERPRRRRLTVPHAWVPRFAFGIAGAAVATIAGLVVHDLGRQPTFAPLPRVTDTMMESPEPQAPVGLPGSPMGAQTAQPTNAPSARHPAAQPPPSTDAPSAEPPRTKSAKPAEPATVRRREVSGAGAASGAAIFRARQAEDAAGPDATRGADSAADERTPGRPELLAYFGALSERLESRMAVPSIETISASKHEVQSTATELADSKWLRLRGDGARTPGDSTWIPLRRNEAGTPAESTWIRLHRGEASTLADSTWIRLRRDEARALADSALASGTLEGCESALRAYWAMLHRDRRPLLATPTARARALAADRLRIEHLLRCASR